MTNNSSFHDFIVFKKFISTKLIMFVYAIGSLYITYRGLITIVKRGRSLLGISTDFSERLLLGLAIIVIGNLIWRVICEGLSVLFMIHDSLFSIEKGLHNKNITDPLIQHDQKEVKKKEEEILKEHIQKAEDDLLKY